MTASETHHAATKHRVTEARSALVVLAHPNPDSFAHELARRAVSGLRSSGVTTELLDLSALGFRAAMSAEEREAYHTDTPILDPMVRSHTDLISSVDTVVFVYPTWWSGLPAILKGWLERTLVPGVGFVFDGDAIRPNLTNVRRLVGISTYGSPRWYVRLANDNGRRTILRALRLACGARVRKRWLALYAIDTTTPTERREFAARVEREMGELG